MAKTVFPDLQIRMNRVPVTAAGGNTSWGNQFEVDIRYIHSRPVKNIIFWGVHHKRPIVPSIGPIEWPNEGGHNFLYLASL